MSENKKYQKFLPITKIPSGSVSPGALVCGDPDRAALIADMLDNYEVLSRRREYHAYKGRYNGLEVTVCSHGVGASGAAITFEELIAAGARTIIRVGTCGSLQSNISDGDLIVASAAVQNTGYGMENFPPGYPASADWKVTLALEQTAESFGSNYRAGIVLTRDVFYASHAAPAYAPDYHKLSKINVLAVEMECAALFMICNMHGVRAGAVLALDGNVLESVESMETYAPDRQVVHQAVESAAHIALQALLSLQ